MSSRQGEAHRKGQQSASSATQAPVARVYTNDELDDLEERNEENVTIDHLYFALDHVAGILEANNIPYALMGGFHMILRGFVSRTTNDVDLAVDAKPRPLLEILGQSARYVMRHHWQYRFELTCFPLQYSPSPHSGSCRKWCRQNLCSHGT